MPFLLTITKVFSLELEQFWNCRDHKPDLKIPQLKIRHIVSLIVRLWPRSRCGRFVGVCFFYKVVSGVFPLGHCWTGSRSFAHCSPCDLHLDCTAVSILSWPTVFIEVFSGIRLAWDATRKWLREWGKLRWNFVWKICQKVGFHILTMDLTFLVKSIKPKEPQWF